MAKGSGEPKSPTIAAHWIEDPNPKRRRKTTSMKKMKHIHMTPTTLKRTE